MRTIIIKAVLTCQPNNNARSNKTGDRRGEVEFREHHNRSYERAADAGDWRTLLQQRQYCPAGSSAAGAEHHYQVWTAVPDKAPPAAGYPVLYMLDGNAVMDKLDDAFLQQLFAGSRR